MTTADMTFSSRVAARAVRIRPLRALLTVLAALFWLPGALVGVLWLMFAWALAAVVEGFNDGSRRTARGRDA